jgi:two-component system, chemotaxis family, CheB/CheR fusion protein
MVKTNATRRKQDRPAPSPGRAVGAGGARGPNGVCPVVGMGASAGGLEAFTRFFQAVPADRGIAFVLIQHLDPTHESLTAELLGRHTKMPVRQLAGDVPVEANHVYVIPPNKYLSISRGVLRLTPPAVERHAVRMPIDFFFRSLAEDQQGRAIGILLSGTGTDGTLGLKEIKMVGGMTIAQDPRSVQHGGMPQSAIANGAVDYVLPVEKMPETLLKYAQHPYVSVDRLEPAVETSADDLTRILALIRARLRFDFTVYKKGTLLRRVHRRMGLRHVEGMVEYLRLLRGDADELKSLFKDFLIGVTRFFRDPPAWQFLEERVLPALVRERDGSAPVRVWVAGCGTGEEAYGLGMALIEQSQAAPRGRPIQVFASDVDEEALDFARAGVYPESIAADVSAARLSRFFVRGENSYRVNKELREAVIFAKQNLIADAPFSRLDLISCRNLLIYLEPEVQKRIVSLFHFALVDGGHLFLGNAESIGSAEDLFDTVSKKWRVYRRIGPTRHDRLRMPVMAAQGEPAFPREAAPPLPLTTSHILGRLQRMLLDRYAPASVVINRRYEILFFSGPVDRYLTQPHGPPTHDLIARLREGLQSRLRSMVHKAVEEGRPQIAPAARVRRDEGWHRVRVTVEPLKSFPETEGLLMVSFAEAEPARPSALDAPSATPTEAEESVVRQLEDELRTSREDLQSTIEELETANEELKAANEEVMSVNEELQSTNEELETSKEELQSLNEELNTVNAQLQTKVDELERVNNDLGNLLTSTNIATVFLDRQLRIRRFTPAATRLFTLLDADVGRPLADIAQRFTDPALLADAQAVLQQLTSRQAEIPAADGRRYFRQVLPYRTQDSRIDGVVLTFSDVAADALLAARTELEVALQRLQAIVDNAADAIITIDEAGTVLTVNRAAERMFGYTVAEVVGKNVRMLMPRPYREEHDGYLRRYLETGVPRIIGIGREVAGLRKDGTSFPIDLAVSEFADGAARKFTGVARDLTERKRAEERAREHQAELAHVLRVRTLGELGAGLAHQLNQPLSSIANDLEACRATLRRGRPGEIVKLIAHASAEAMRAGGIVRRFREMARKVPPRLERIDLRDVIRGVADLLAPRVAQLDVTFQVDLPAKPLPVRADRIQIEQVVINLVQNALEAVQGVSVGGRRKVGVRAVRVEVATAPGGEAKVLVNDNGPGIPAQTATHVFEPFFTTKREGLGMGLTIARSIVEAHRGRLWIERRRATAGARVCFSLPLFDKAEKERSHGARSRRVRDRR